MKVTLIDKNPVVSLEKTETYRNAPGDVQELLQAVTQDSTAKFTIRVITCRCRPGQWPCEC